MTERSSPAGTACGNCPGRQRTGTPASRAYFALVHARMDELREKPITGTQTMRDFIQRRR